MCRLCSASHEQYQAHNSDEFPVSQNSFTYVYRYYSTWVGKRGCHEKRTRLYILLVLRSWTSAVVKPSRSFFGNCSSTLLHGASMTAVVIRVEQSLCGLFIVITTQNRPSYKLGKKYSRFSSSQCQTWWKTTFRRLDSARSHQLIYSVRR